MPKVLIWKNAINKDRDKYKKNITNAIDKCINDAILLEKLEIEITLSDVKNTEFIEHIVLEYLENIDYISYIVYSSNPKIFYIEL